MTPTVHIDAPANGSTVKGVTTVQATATLDPAGGDTIDALTLFVDGGQRDTEYCRQPSQVACTVDLSWDATGVLGTHQEQVVLTTANGTSAHSQVVSVTVHNPDPSAVVLMPAPGATVGGDDIDVRATLAVDASQTDAPIGGTVYVDGEYGGGTRCPEVSPAPRTCTVDIDWDTRYLTPGDHELTVEVMTETQSTGTSVAFHVTFVRAPAPVAVITSPVAGTTVSGTTTVTATASSPGWSLGNLPKYLQLVVDGYGEGPQVPCATDVDDCSATFSWDATPLTGAHTISAFFVTGQRPNISAPVTVNAVEPTPTAIIASPDAGSVAPGGVTIVTAGSTAAGSADVPRTMQLMIDGVPYGRAGACPTGATPQHGCTVLLQWFTGSLYGPHTVQTRMQTSTTTVLSAPRTFFVGARQAHVSVSGVRYGGQYYVKGNVADAGYAPIAGAAVTVTLTQAGTAARTLVGTTGPDGVYAIVSPVAFTVNTRLVAQVGVELSSATATQSITVAARVSCAVPGTAKHGVKVKVTCKVPGLPNGTTVTLWYAGKAGSHNAAHARAKNGKVTMTFAVARKSQRLRVWAATADNPKFVRGVSASYKLHIV